MEGTQSGRAKSMQTHSPKKWSHVAAQNQRNVSKGAGMPVLFWASEVEPWQPQAMERHLYSWGQCTGPWAQPLSTPRHPPTSKLTYFRTLQNSFTRKAARDGFCEWQRWFLGSGARLASNPLWFATHAWVVFHELLTSVASRPLWFGFRALVVFREMLSSFASKPLWFVPHALVGFA